MSIGVAILGGGIFAREEHLPAVEKSKDLTLKAVYSRSLKSAKTLGTDESKVALYSEDSGAGKSLNDLLARDDIHAVIIALPIKNQPEYVRKCIEARKHVLSEKPVAENVADAVELIEWYESSAPKGVLWAVAENGRFWASVLRAGEISNTLGDLLTFRARMQFLVKEGSKYYETDWRKTPTHQGGFLLDGGVHFAAVLRHLMGKEEIVSIAAHTAQLQKYLPPVDTIEATAKTKNGALGSISISMGTTASGSEYNVGRTQGFVSLTHNKMVKHGDKEETVEDAEEERSGVVPEVRVWGEGIVNGRLDARQSPREALADLEIIEACLRSGEQDAKPVSLSHQKI